MRRECEKRLVRVKEREETSLREMRKITNRANGV